MDIFRDIGFGNRPVLDILLQNPMDRQRTTAAPVEKLSVALTIVLSAIFLKETVLLKAAIGAVMTMG